MLRKLLGALACLLTFSCHPLPAGADDGVMVARSPDGKVTITLYTGVPCKLDGAAEYMAIVFQRRLAPEDVKHGVAEAGQQKLDLCWAKHDEPEPHVDGVLESGQPFELPAREFNRGTRTSN